MSKEENISKDTQPDTEQTPQATAQAEGQTEKKTEAPSLKEVIAERATEDEAPLSRTFSLRQILGGDILNTRIIRQQLWLFVLIVGFTIVYVSNRYSCQKDLIEIDRLQKELKDAKYKALSSSSQLTEKSRESHVLELLQANKDSTLKIATQPPYIIEIPENE